MLFYQLNQGFDLLIIALLRDDRKLISADPEYGTVLEGFADNPARAPDQLIPCIMTGGIIDRLQVIYIQYREPGPFPFLSHCSPAGRMTRQTPL